MINQTDEPLALGMHPTDVFEDSKDGDLVKEEIVVAPALYADGAVSQEENVPAVTKKELW